ncbi:hypothetical protein B0H13DRAFT_2230669 [Mycena leptocephala]|nr:hypothetical protein B0H13DRAFT_2230669 [Mycena leptocephala]
MSGTGSCSSMIDPRDEIQRGFDCINRQNYVHALVEHPLGSIVEYPETGASKGVGIAHRFSVDPANFCHPKECFQYSLGDSHGGEPYVRCGSLLLGLNGMPASCFHKKLSCKPFFCVCVCMLYGIDRTHSGKGLKYCSAWSLPSSPLPLFKLDSLAEARKEIFLKTLAFYCTLAEKGCAFDLGTDGEDIGSIELTDKAPDPDSDSDSESDKESDAEETDSHTNIIRDSRRKKSSHSFCKGKLELRHDEYGRAFVQCEHRTTTDRAHLILRTLDEFDIPYLRALLKNDAVAIDEHENLARQLGYGPRILCFFTHWHRQSGTLARVVVICRNPHSHPNPHTVKTPPPLLEVFRTLLLDLDWKLADATPRKLMLDSGFMSGFRRALGWSRPFDPPLDALHASLGNLDHIRRYIDELRHVLFPEGTGFEGAQLLAAQHRELPEDEQYVRCAEKHTLKDGKIFYLVICMLRSMSALLMRSKKLSLDTAFKRLNGKWQEFEMETTELERMKCKGVHSYRIHLCSLVDGTRAFTTSQSAEAHVILFTRVFQIAFEDTGVPCRFRHIHGDGFELWIADAHKGQALEIMCRTGRCLLPLEPTQLLRRLNPYDHLRRCFRLCTTHDTRNIDKLKPHITQKVRNAMLSLSSSQVHPNLEEAFRVIEGGGRKAKAWFKDKQVGSKFALPALYQPASLIPLEIWKSAPSTTNGNEQAHRNINRDGVNLTMLGGIMRGMQYDARAMGTLELHSSQGIYSRDQTATHFRRLQRSLNRYAPSQIDSPVVSDSNSQRKNPARAANTAPLFTSTPLAQAPGSSDSLSQSSWLDEHMQVDVPGAPLRVDMPATSFHHHTTERDASDSAYPQFPSGPLV